MRYEIALPVYDNSGFTTLQARNLVKEKILEAFGGYTEYQARGVWKGEGTTYHDVNDVVVVFAQTDADQTIREIATLAAQLMGQERIFVGKIPATFELVYP